MKKKILLISLLFIASLSFSGKRYYHSSTTTSYQYNVNDKDKSFEYEFSEKYSDKTGHHEIPLENLSDTIKFDLEVRTYSGDINIKLVDNLGNILLDLKNPKEVKKILKIDTNKKYKIVLDFFNHSGKYEIELESFE